MIRDKYLAVLRCLQTEGGGRECEVMSTVNQVFFTGKGEWEAEGSCGETLEALDEAYFLIKGIL